MTGAATGRVLVSACLLGRPVRYDGRAKRSDDVVLARWTREGRVVPLCPEVAAGLPTPRPPAEIRAGRVVERDGRDVTDLYERGARITVETARRAGCRHALLTDGSPSCGSTFRYDGTFEGGRVGGEGLVAAALRRAGVAVWPETEIAALDAQLRAGGVVQDAAGIVEAYPISRGNRLDL